MIRGRGVRGVMARFRWGLGIGSALPLAELARRICSCSRVSRRGGWTLRARSGSGSRRCCLWRTRRSGSRMWCVRGWLGWTIREYWCAAGLGTTGVMGWRLRGICTTGVLGLVLCWCFGWVMVAGVEGWLGCSLRWFGRWVCRWLGVVMVVMGRWMGEGGWWVLLGFWFWVGSVWFRMWLWMRFWELARVGRWMG